MVLPFGPAEKQALLEAADTTARAKLLIALPGNERLRPAAGDARRSGPTRLQHARDQPAMSRRFQSFLRSRRRAAAASIRSCWKSWSARRPTGRWSMMRRPAS